MKPQVITAQPQAQTVRDRFADFSDFVFVSLDSPVDFLSLLDNLVTLGFYIKRVSPVTVSVQKASHRDQVSQLHHLDYSTDFGFEWSKVLKRLDAMGLDSPKTLILNNMASDQPDFVVEAALLEGLVPCLVS